jgi:aspartate racemase
MSRNVRQQAPAAEGASEKVIGVLGGMGPEATLAFYARLIAHTPAGRDQDHLRVVIDSNPKVPDRTAALVARGESPVEEMAASLARLRRAGADFVVIPCVSAHGFLDELRRRTRLPVVSLIDAAADHLRTDHPTIRRVGLLSTAGTVRSGRFQERLASVGVATIVPAAADQAAVMSAIYAIKGSASAASRTRARAALRAVADRLVAAGAQGIVLGCTEIPLVLVPGDVGVPLFDVLVILARAAIVAAGRQPLELAPV